MCIIQTRIKVYLDTFRATQKQRANIRGYMIAASRVNTPSSDHILVVEIILYTAKKELHQFLLHWMGNMYIIQTPIKMHLDTFRATQRERANGRSYIMAASRVNTLSNDHIRVVERILYTTKKELHQFLLHWMGNMCIIQTPIKVYLDTFRATQRERANGRSYIIAASRVNTLSSDHICVVEIILCTTKKELHQFLL